MMATLPVVHVHIGLCLQEAKLLDAKSRNNMYFIEYTVTKPAQEQKHLLSAVALGFNGRYRSIAAAAGPSCAVYATPAEQLPTFALCCSAA